MALDFPSSPALGATYSSGGSIWTWDGVKWAQSALAPNPPIVAPPLAASWTQRNFVGTTSLADTANGVLLKETLFQNADVIRAASIAAPAAPYTLDLNMNCFVASAGANSILFGWTDGTKYHVGALNNGPITSVGTLPKTTSVYKFTNTTTYFGADYAGNYFDWNSNNMFYRLTDNGTNVSFSASNDGINYLLIFTVAKSSGYLGASGYTNLVWGVDTNIGTVPLQPPAVMVALKSWWVH